jgi:serine/threonine-protein kinase RsbW
MRAIARWRVVQAFERRMNHETARTREGGGIRGTKPIKLMVPSRAEYVLLARLVVAQVGQVAGFGADDVYDLKLAVTEAVTNVIRHARVDEYEVQYRASEGVVEIVVIDRGGGFDESGLSGNPGGRGGFGLTVIRNLVDEVAIERADGGGTRITMIRRSTPTVEESAG